MIQKWIEVEHGGLKFIRFSTYHQKRKKVNNACDIFRYRWSAKFQRIFSK